MKDLHLTILETNQIFGNNRLEIFKNRRTQAAISDYAICCGGDSFYTYYVGEEKLEKRKGWYWTKTDGGHNDAHVVNADGDDIRYYVGHRRGGVRPALPFSAISSICSNKVRAGDRILKVEYGEYPQKAVSKQLQEELERLFQRVSLLKTGKYYTRDFVKNNEYDVKFHKETQEEYKYNGKKYVRVRVNSYYRSKFELSNEEEYQDGDYVWIEVSPIKWLVDKKNDIAVAEKILFAGVQFKNTGDYKGDFENTDLYKYMDTYFSKEMKSMTRINTNNQEESITEIRKNPYDFESVTEEENNVPNENNIEENNVSNYQLQTDTRNPIITSANFSPEHGLHIFVELPTEVIEPEEITVEINNKELKKVYTLKI